MAFFARRLTSLALAFALSASPAALSACLALCMEGVGKVASHAHVRVSAERDETELAAPAHHCAVAFIPPEATDARLSSGVEDCCAYNPQAFVSRLGTDRLDGKSIAARVATPVASFLLAHAHTRSSHVRLPVARLAPPRAPLSLRI